MKTAKEWFDTMITGSPDIKEVISEIQREAYNQALEDVVKSIKLKLYSLSPYDDTSDGYDLKETSTPPLYTRGFNGFINGKLEIDKDSILKLKR